MANKKARAVVKAMGPRYIYDVTTVCRATLTEQWRVTSDKPLTWDDLEDIVIKGDETEGDLKFISESSGDEDDREIVHWIQADE